MPIIGDGSKKKARHVAIMEAMKRAQKKREAAAAKQPRTFPFPSSLPTSRADLLIREQLPASLVEST